MTPLHLFFKETTWRRCRQSLTGSRPRSRKKATLCRKSGNRIRNRSRNQFQSNELRRSGSWSRTASSSGTTSRIRSGSSKKTTSATDPRSHYLGEDPIPFPGIRKTLGLQKLPFLYLGEDPIDRHNLERELPICPPEIVVGDYDFQ